MDDRGFMHEMPTVPGLGNEYKAGSMGSLVGDMIEARNMHMGGKNIRPFEDPGLYIDRMHGRKFTPPLKPPQFDSVAGGGFDGFSNWINAHGEPGVVPVDPYPNKITDPYLP